MRRSTLAALAFTIALAVPSVAFASPQTSRIIRPADAPGANVVPRNVHMSRPMDLVGWVDVQGDASGRAQAMAALRQKAVAMGGDGIIDVEFHPGANGTPGHYTASAVSFRKLHGQTSPAPRGTAQARTSSQAKPPAPPQSQAQPHAPAQPQAHAPAPAPAHR
jgi:hypothetical protein